METMLLNGLGSTIKMNYYEFSEKNCYEVVIVGGGTCGLAAASRLCEDSPGSIYTEDEHQRFHWLRQRSGKVNLINRNVSSKTTFKPPNNSSAYKLKKKYSSDEILVLDAISDQWLGQWDHQFETCLIPFLRSPMFFHPDPVNVDGLVSYAHMMRKEGPQHLKEIENVVGKEISKHKQKKLRMKMKKKVAMEEPHPVPINGINSGHNARGLTDINMRDWKDYYRPSTPLFREFCQDIIQRYRLENVVRKDKVVDIEYCFINIIETNESGKGFVIRTESGRIYACKACIVTSGHAGQINFPIKPFQDLPDDSFEGSCHTTHIFLRTVPHFPDEKVMKKVRAGKPSSIVVVGGGLTSAQLVDVAIRSGVEKCFLLLRGPLKIKHFDFHLEWVTKYKNVKKSAFYMLDSDEERFQMIQEAREGGSVNPEYYRKIMKHVKSGKLELMRFTTIEEQTYDKDAKSWTLKLKTKPSKSNSLLVSTTDDGQDVDSMSSYQNLDNVDYIYFATGITANLRKLLFLNNILDNHPIELIQGLPVLTDNLQWNNEIPLFMSGKNAQLKMGPSSANLDGARLGAERVGWYLQEKRSQGYFDWTSPPVLPDCRICDDNSDYTNSLDSELNADSTESLPTTQSSSSLNDKETISTFETRLKLAGGEMNWYSLLDIE
jgi:cation diffusion facilitator CzcD-associated flavoprotein CzcO